ncbi:MAG: methyltransferase domain-containing protein [Candidatus Taylorbacteria bacterium]|nr:methyltransferase domain-containing protein [Candidatus Taylorbacteria bacterium]
MKPDAESIPNKINAPKQIRGGFDDRVVDFHLIHNQKTEDVRVFIDIIDSKPNDVILDGMDGYGAVAREILDTTEPKGFQPEIYTVDESVVQVERARQNMPDVQEDHLVQADIRNMPFEDKKFNTVIIKMGIHELPKSAQPDILKEVSRVLKPGGKFVTWELSFPDEASQVIFQDIIRKKDELAGFNRLVENRYFPRQDELLKLFADAGFEKVEVAHKVDAKLSMRVREQELVSKERKQIMSEEGTLTAEKEKELAELGKERCDQLVAFIKEYMSRVPESIRKQMEYYESENDTFLSPNKDIILGYKPESV